MLPAPPHHGSAHISLDILLVLCLYYFYGASLHIRYRNFVPCAMIIGTQPSPSNLPSPIFASVDAGSDGVTAVTPHFFTWRGWPKAGLTEMIKVQIQQCEATSESAPWNKRTQLR